MERKIFHWIVKNLHGLSRIPGLAHFFDTALFIWTAIFHPQQRKAMELLEKKVLESFPCHLGTHHYGGIAFRFQNQEIAHLHGNGLLDVYLPRARCAVLIETGQAETHHILGTSSWLSYWMNNPDDVPGALALINEAVSARVKEIIG